MFARQRRWRIIITPGFECIGRLLLAGSFLLLFFFVQSYCRFNKTCEFLFLCLILFVFVFFLIKITHNDVFMLHGVSVVFRLTLGVRNVGRRRSGSLILLIILSACLLNVSRRNHHLLLHLDDSLVQFGAGCHFFLELCKHTWRIVLLRIVVKYHHSVLLIYRRVYLTVLDLRNHKYWFMHTTIYLRFFFEDIKF